MNDLNLTKEDVARCFEAHQKEIQYISATQLDIAVRRIDDDLVGLQQIARLLNLTKEESTDFSDNLNKARYALSKFHLCV